MEIDEPARADLIAAARQAAGQAYCPYSRFRVGAAVLTDRGEIFSGCNVENASYGLTICAERNAIFQAVARSQAPVVIRAVVVFTPTDLPTAPCGACRQVINEFGPEAFVLSVCDGEEVIEIRLSELLPRAFGPANLEPLRKTENTASR
ncbi:MAG TPA: cytidine deaminase [Isosphaeraceae bacterium]|nr:cytidine deaminase [Isosphaeraceae bacterium]